MGIAPLWTKHHAITNSPLRPRLSRGAPDRFAALRLSNGPRRTTVCSLSEGGSAEASGANASQTSRGDVKRAKQKNTKASKGEVEEERSWRKPMTYTIFRRSHDKEIIGMAVPSYIAVLLDPIATLIDISFIGRLPEAGLNLAGVGIGNAITNYFVGTFFFLAVTTTTTLAQGLAQASVIASQDPSDEARLQGERECSAIVAGSMRIAFGIGCIMASVAWVCAPQLAALLTSEQSAAALPYAIEYLRAKAVGIPLSYTYFAILGTYRGYKDLGTPLLGNAIFCLLKVALGYLFLFVLGTGLKGTGLAEALARIVCISILTALLVLKGRLLPADFLSPVKKSLFVDLLAPGGALTSRKIVEQLALSLTTKMSATFGPATVAASELVRQCYSVLSTLWWPLSVAGQTLIAAALAKWNSTSRLSCLREARGVAIRCMLLGGVISGLGAVGVISGREIIPRLMTNTKDLEVYAIAAKLLPVAACVMPIAAINDVCEAAFIAAKDYRLVLRGMISGSLACAATLYIGSALGWGFVTVWIAIGALIATRALVSISKFNSADCSIPPTRCLDQRERAAKEKEALDGTPAASTL